MEFQRTGRYDLMYMKTKELGWKETRGIQNIGIEDYKGNKIVEQNQVLNILENYITELHDRPNRPQTLEVETEEEVDTDEKDPYISQSEVEEAIKDVRNKKATGDDDVRGDVLKISGKNGLKIMKNLVKTINETGEWLKNIMEDTMIALNKQPEATKCSDNRSISIITNTVMIVAKIIIRKLEKKIEDLLREKQFVFRREKGIRDATGKLRIISEQTLKIDKKLFPS
jgi:hypothetical protein